MAARETGQTEYMRELIRALDCGHGVTPDPARQVELLDQVSRNLYNNEDLFPSIISEMGRIGVISPNSTVIDSACHIVERIGMRGEGCAHGHPLTQQSLEVLTDIAQNNPAVSGKFHAIHTASRLFMAAPIYAVPYFHDQFQALAVKEGLLTCLKRKFTDRVNPVNSALEQMDMLYSAAVARRPAAATTFSPRPSTPL